ncbi:cation ABC transporter substrate-binding protein, partial [Campylobacter upsaliensis]|nr:cation ABC transporter substrate-binding protein [Campylobacter upsaliensis]
MKKILLFLFFGFSFLMAKPVVSVSIAPQEFFVKKIAGDS